MRAEGPGWLRDPGCFVCGRQGCRQHEEAHQSDGSVRVHALCRPLQGGDGRVRGKSIIDIRSQLLGDGFPQGFTKNKKGYLFQNAIGEG
jgi:hypothetical protein